MNGPALAARGSQVAIAWFTEGSDARPRVQWAASRDGGRTFGVPQVVDNGAPLGRVGVALLADGSTLVSWLATVGEGSELRVRRYPVTGAPEPPLVVARVAGDRSAGFPQLLAAGDRALLAWTAAQGLKAAVLRVE